MKVAYLVSEIISEHKELQENNQETLKQYGIMFPTIEE